MKHFLNLSSRAINRRHIIEIVKRPYEYEILLNCATINGVVLFSNGGITTLYNTITVSSQSNKKDYDKISRWIKK